VSEKPARIDFQVASVYIFKVIAYCNEFEIRFFARPIIRGVFGWHSPCFFVLWEQKPESVNIYEPAKESLVVDGRARIRMGACQGGISAGFGPNPARPHRKWAQGPDDHASDLPGIIVKPGG